MNRIRYVVGTLGLWGHLIAAAQPVTDPVADLFAPRPPLPPGTEHSTPAVLRPAETTPATPPTPIVVRPSSLPGYRPPFVLQPGERVLFLGDALLEAEAEHGYLETRLNSHYPNAPLTFRNLSRSPHNRLREPDPSVAAADAAWMPALVEEVRALQPGVIFLSYGTAGAWRGADSLTAFTNVYDRLLGALRSLHTNTRPRLVLLGPLSCAPPQGGDWVEITNRNPTFLQFSEAAWLISSNHQADFVDLFQFSRSEVARAFRAREGGEPRPALTTDGVRPTAHGLRRFSLALDRGLRWPGNIWRWGLMADGQWRPGGFGAVIQSHQRREDYVKVLFSEERLPTPPTPVAVPLEEGWEPLAYMQVRNLNPGLYELRVDGTALLTGTHADWHRYLTLQRGPSWDQAEALRRAIVEKNRLWETLWNARRQQPDAPNPETDARLAEAEARIRELKRPHPHTYEIVRIGDAPAGTPDLSNVHAP